MRLIAELTMPKCGSWNGQWSGENDRYTVAFKTSPREVEKLVGRYYYNWPDGWGVSVEVRKPFPREKVTGRFCGYNWMIDSIRQHGKIIA